jgi:hypothetical protein
MSSTFYDQLANVPADDVDVAAPTEYVDGGVGPVPEATYDLRILEFQPDFKDDGTFSKSVTIKSAEIIGVDKEELKRFLGRKVTNLRVWTTTYLRNNVKVSGLGDLIRGLDDERAWSGIKEAVDIIQEHQDKNTPLQIKLAWGAFDKAGFDAAGGAMLVDKSPEKKELQKKAAVRGMKNFRPLPDGSYAPEVAGPLSGDLLEARLEIDRITPRRKRRQLITS